MDDPEYKVWLKLYHTESVTSSGCLRSSPSSSETSPVLSEILTLPKPPARRKKGNSKRKRPDRKHSRQKGEWNVNNKGRKRKTFEVQERERRTGPFLRHLLRWISHLKLVHSVIGGKTSQKRGHDGSVVTSVKDGSILIF